ncbi:MAG: (Fe-S)-binding protein [Sphingobium sp.]
MDGPLNMIPARPHVGLLVTCLVDLLRPSVGEAAVQLLEDAGCTVDVPSQSCCGQPAFNAGDREDARALAQNMIAALEGYDYVVVPSGSCGGMVKLHYAELFDPGSEWFGRAQALAERTFELTMFLTDILDYHPSPPPLDARITYHDSCSSLRELGIAAQPRAALDRIAGLERVELEDTRICCGFGGLFCVKYGEISNEMVSRKAEAILATGADMVVAGDLGCLLNIAGKLSRMGARVQARHIAELLAGMTERPAIGEAKT